MQLYCRQYNRPTYKTVFKDHTYSIDIVKNTLVINECDIYVIQLLFVEILSRYLTERDIVISVVDIQNIKLRVSLAAIDLG